MELQKVWSALFSRKTLIAAAAVALLLGVFGVAVRAWWLAHEQAVHERLTASRPFSSQLGFTFSRVASNVNSPFTSIAAAADYRTATVFEGDLFVSESRPYTGARRTGN